MFLNSNATALTIAALALVLLCTAKYHYRKKIKDVSLLDTIGNTPLIKIRSLSRETGCEIYGKAEFLNPGGSVKDRVALQIITEAIDKGDLIPGALITEGTAGSTGISLAMISKAIGCRCMIVMPDDAAIEKSQILEALGAEVKKVRPVSIVHPEHFVNIAKKATKEETGGIFCDQFENEANFRAHLKTGKEIWEQTNKKINAFVCGAGTGGTIAGVSNYLKNKNSNIKIYLSDPAGSGLFNKIEKGVLFSPEEAEGSRLRNPNDTITEGVGINRLTRNFSLALIDGAFKCSDQEAVEMGHYLVRNEGLFVGSSSCVNCVGAVKAARKLSPGSIIVTILCDSGERYLSKFYNAKFLKESNLQPRFIDSSLDFTNC